MRIHFLLFQISFVSQLTANLHNRTIKWMKKKTTWNGLETEDESSSSYWSVVFFSLLMIFDFPILFSTTSTLISSAQITFLLFCSPSSTAETAETVFGESKQKWRPLSIFVGDSAIFVRGQTYNREEWEEVLRPSSMSPFWSQIMLKAQRENWSISTVKVLTILSNSPAAKKLIRLIAHEN